MKKLQRDIAVIGDSLAARMAAALLAKHGRKVLLLPSPSSPDHWQSSSAFVERLLAALGGRSCFRPCQPFQVLSTRARVTIDPELPLSDELLREFGNAGQAVLGFLAELEQLGREFETLLWEHGGLPLPGVANTARWRWLCLRRKLPLTALAAPLSSRLAAFPEPAAEWLTDLFQGLSLQSLATLTVGDGALLWRQARATEMISLPDLEQLLDKRLEQFHGSTAELADLTVVEQHGGQWHGTFRSGGGFTATHLMAGDLGWRFPGVHHPLPLELPPPPRQVVTTSLDERISPLLTQRVIAGGPLSLRLIIDRTRPGGSARISAPAGADEAAIRRQLAAVLPFARYDIEPDANTAPFAAAIAPPPLLKLPLQVGSHLWALDERHLVPQLGTCGAALLAWTVARQIDPAIAPREH